MRISLHHIIAKRCHMEMDFTKLVNRKTAICDKEVYLEFSVLVPIIKTGSEFSLLLKSDRRSLPSSLTKYASLEGR